jgi:hypothetical protein
MRQSISGVHQYVNVAPGCCSLLRVLIAGCAETFPAPEAPGVLKGKGKKQAACLAGRCKIRIAAARPFTLPGNGLLFRGVKMQGR